jgi:lysophospholipase L1-like esterase
MYAVPMQNALPERRYYSDGVHPSRLGYETMAKVWLDALVAADES